MIEPLPQLNIFSSNRVELLYKNLKQNLFKRKAHPFARRMIVVPNASMKSWLLLQLASDPDFGIAAGIDVCYLDQALKTFTTEIRREKGAFIPNSMQLAFLFEAIISKIITEWSSYNEEEQHLWKPLIQYLRVSADYPLGQKSQQRLIALSNRLAQLFLQYGRYGCRMLDSWENSKVINSWQAQLWRRLKLEYPNLYFPYQLLPEVLNNMKVPLQDTQLHIFALSFIPAQAHRFLAKIADFFPVRYYLLSPCQLFWNDICSDKERTRLQSYWEKKGVSKAQLQALDQFLRERNAILANFGRMGREMANQIENDAGLIEDSYQLPEIFKHLSIYNEEITDDILYDTTIKPPTLLQALQADLLVLRNPNKHSKLDFPSKDSSIQLHLSYSKQREIENLYNTLIHLLTIHSKEDESIEPGDIIIMVPDLLSYESTIHSVFGGEKSLLDFQIMETALLSKTSLVQGFLHLLSLPGSRWEADSIVQLLEYEPFKRKFDFSSSDLLQIKKWIEESGTYWGQNLRHCHEVITRDHGAESKLVDLNPAGTWEYSLSRLLMTFAIASEGLDTSHHTFAPPLDEMESSQSDLLGKWLSLILGLQKDLKPIAECTKMSLKNWAEYLERLKGTYFQIEINDLEGIEASKHLSQLIESLCFESKNLFSFQSVYCQLANLINDELTSYRECNLQAVRFCSMLPMRALPAKVVGLIGMNEGAFPRKEIPFSLNEMAFHPDADYAPNQTDFDRYLFLESLLSARQYLILSFVGFSFEEQREVPPSLLIQELFSYLDSGYTLEGISPSIHCLQKHPFNPFDKAYFQETSLFPSYSQEYYKLAKAYYFSEKTQAHQFVTNFNIKQSDILEATVIIKELASFASNPLKGYFNKSLNIYLDKNQNEIKNVEPFALSGLEKYQLRMQAIKKPIDDVLNNASRSGKLPGGLFRMISSEYVISEIEKMHHSFFLNQISPNELFSLYFSDHCEKPQMNEKIWMLPPLDVKIKDGVKVKVVGHLEEVSNQGLLFHQSRDLKGIIKAWPKYLLLCHAVSKFDLPIATKLISTKDDKPFTFPLEEASSQLEAFIAYYFMALQSPSPLIPEWVSSFLKPDSNTLAKNMQASLEGSFSTLYNDYALWLFRDRQNLPPAEELFKQWEPIAKKLFSRLQECL